MTTRILKYCVGALTTREVEEIIFCDETDRLCDIIDLGLMRKFPERFPWKNDPKAMEKFNEEVSSGPFKFAVLFFTEQP